mmetsp:Transcript_3631/g.11257  ORF Transcript_3631/g.11257 Transcript_3631/m.11257 type:complete len:171 (+) Transcript_3631:1056-1568(+)
MSSDEKTAYKKIIGKQASLPGECVKVHYRGWEVRWDQWMQRFDDRQLMPLGSMKSWREGLEVGDVLEATKEFNPKGTTNGTWLAVEIADICTNWIKLKLDSKSNHYRSSSPWWVERQSECVTYAGAHLPHLMKRAKKLKVVREIAKKLKEKRASAPKPPSPPSPSADADY